MVRKEPDGNEPQHQNNDDFIEFLINGSVCSDEEIAAIEKTEKYCRIAGTQLMVDSTLLIDYFRKTNNAKARLLSHFKAYNRLYISSVTEFKVINNVTKVHL